VLRAPGEACDDLRGHPLFALQRIDGDLLQMRTENVGDLAPERSKQVL
jgi:hypothetical protein